MIPARPPGRSRRALLTAGAVVVAGGASTALAACGSNGRTGARSVHHARVPVRREDIALLGSLLELERRTVAAYTATVPLLGRADAKTAKQFLNEELEHTGELISLIKAAGGKAGPRVAPFDLGHPTGEAGALALLHDLEHAQIDGYLRTIPRLSPGPVRAAAATILASDAQHIAVLRIAQGRPPMTSAFLTAAE